MSDQPYRFAPDAADSPLMLRSAALARNWWAILIRGIAAVIFGVIAFLLPAQALSVLVLLFGAYLLVDGVFAIVAAITAAARHARWGLLLLEGVVDIIVGLIALVVPAAAVIGVVWLTAAWAVVTGGLMLAAAFGLHRAHGNWLLGLGGIISIVWGVLLWLWPLVGAIVLTLWLGAYALIFGIAMIAFALRLRARYRSA
jgi:uncharacterized membrane protein HdeD (DUF308 family)